MGVLVATNDEDGVGYGSLDGRSSASAGSHSGDGRPEAGPGGTRRRGRAGGRVQSRARAVGLDRAERPGGRPSCRPSMRADGLDDETTKEKGNEKGKRKKMDEDDESRGESSEATAFSTSNLPVPIS
ncbi:hypothetical protein RJ55_04769 [Drechmeria coniospora]|nr:hypothetical protein RJ55_04769 [Drechmeria coniospora]